MEIIKSSDSSKYYPHMVLLCLIFFFQYFSKAKEIQKSLNPEQQAKASKIFWKYLIVFQLAKAADWCLGPYTYEFFEGYHGLTQDGIAKMLAVSFIANLFFGPSLIGYLNDKCDKKFPCILYGLLMSASCLIRQIKSPYALVLSQLFFGVSSSVLYTSFENWFVAEVNNNITDDDVKQNVLSLAFEKSIIGDSFTAMGVSFITGLLKVTLSLFRKLMEFKRLTTSRLVYVD
jgi:predicted MFS family arabinose efflux permease